MPTYEYRCRSCSTVEEIIHSIKESPNIVCSSCGADSCERLISHNITGVIIKGDTPAKLLKESNHRRKKNADLEVRQMERWGSSGPRIVPNVNGEEVGSWSEASKLAKDKGLKTETYSPMIEKEKSTSKLSGVDDKAWKSAKEKKNNS